MDAMQQFSFHFFGLDVHIHTNCADFADIFQINYARFLANPPVGEHDPLNFHLIEKTHQGLFRPVLIYKEREFLLPKPDMPGNRFIGQVFSELQRRVSSHILIHAGVVSRDGQGIILAADSMHGKSTLVLELVQRGFKFLSDEMAAIHRYDRQVYPFPRSLRVLPESLSRLSLSLPTGSREWLGKYTIDIETLFPGSMGTPVPIRHIIILADPAHPPENTGRNPDDQMWFCLDGCPPRFLAELSALESVRHLSHETIEDIVLFRFHTNQRSVALGQARALARRHQLAWLGSDALLYRQAAFSQSARLLPISRSQAALQLLRYFQGTHQSALLGHASGSYAAPLFSELAMLISQADCHQLFLGPLSEMADLIETLPAGERP